MTEHTPGPWTIQTIEPDWDISGDMEARIQAPTKANGDSLGTESLIHKPYLYNVAVLKFVSMKRSIHHILRDEGEANARLIADAPDRHDQLTALLLFGWEVNKRSIYDEEGIEAWVWTEPDGTEHFDIGAGWDELPDWPDSARAALAAAKATP